ncbi:MAG: BTAD domain-containing putative transcriptional regulator [Acidimicrobiia bacterium]
MEFRVLGPLEVSDGDTRVTLGRPQQRTVLAILLVHANEVVSTDFLIEELWGGDPPLASRKSLQSHVASLRRVLNVDGELLRAQPPGYVLSVETEQVDALQFERLIRDASSKLGADPQRAREELSEGLGLWRGAPLADVTDEPPTLRAEVARLEELRLVAWERRIEAELALGDHVEVVGELEHLTEQYPLREGLWARLMLALYRSGRQAEALGAYQKARRLLGKELGIEPSGELQRLEEQVLLQDSDLTWTHPAPSPKEGTEALPEGSVTFLFTDIEGSTRLWEDHPKTMREALARHDEVLRQAIERRSGYVFSTAGDAFSAAFQSPEDAFSAAIEAQAGLAAERWGSVELRVRMSLHTGVAEERGGDYFGPTLNRAARLLSAGHGGQVLVSQATEFLIRESLPSGTGLLDLGVHRLRDLSQPLQVYQLVHEQLPQEFPPLQSLEGFPNNLPASVSTFVEREAEIAEVTEVLRTSRLVTLTGAGGSGKTRLALQVAVEILGEFPDGAWFVGLAGLNDPDLVPGEVAAALQLTEKPGREWLEVLSSFLSDRELLLVVDNCEHLIDPVADLTLAMLETAPGLRVLATSRETLSLPGETSWLVPSMAIPTDGHDSSIDELMRFEGVQLFIERAQAARPDLAVGDDDAAAVVEICRRLDGLPLALELAAARVRALSLQQIASRLDDRFALLTGGSRAALPRHRTLEGAVAWSYELLSPEEQGLLERLSVFAGGFDLEAANQVAGGDVLSGVTSLVEKSLLAAEPHGEEVRYRMLETVAAFGQQQLGDRAGEVRNAHLAWAAKLARAAAANLVEGPDQAAWLTRVETELDNFRAAMRWALDEGDPATGMGVVASLLRYWDPRGLREGVRWVELFLAASPQVSDEVMAWTLFTGGALMAVQDEHGYERAAELLERSLALFRGLGERHGAAYALHYLVRTQWGQIDPGELRAGFDTALAGFREVDDLFGVATSLWVMAHWELEYGETARALAMVDELEALNRRMGSHLFLSHGTEISATARWYGGDYETARPLLHEALGLYRQNVSPQCAAHCLDSTAAWALGAGDPETATVLLGATDVLRADIGVRHPIDESFLSKDEVLGEAEAALGKRAFTAAWQRGQAMGPEEALDTAIAATSSSTRLGVEDAT